MPNYCFGVVEPWQHELKVLNPELAEILESGGIDETRFKFRRRWRGSVGSGQTTSGGRL